MNAPTSNFEKTFEFLKMLYGSSIDGHTRADRMIYVYQVNVLDTIGPGRRIGVSTKRDMVDAIKSERATHITPNQFYVPENDLCKLSMSHAQVSWINAIVLNFSECESIKSVVKKLEQLELEKGVKSTLIDRMKKGHAVWFLFDQSIKVTSETTEQYHTIYKGLIKLTGADPIIRMPITYERIPRDIQYFDQQNRVSFKMLHEMMVLTE